MAYVYTLETNTIVKAIYTCNLPKRFLCHFVIIFFNLFLPCFSPSMVIIHAAVCHNVSFHVLVLILINSTSWTWSCTISQQNISRFIYDVVPTNVSYFEIVFLSICIYQSFFFSIHLYMYIWIVTNFCLLKTALNISGTHFYLSWINTKEWDGSIMW